MKGYRHLIQAGMLAAVVVILDQVAKALVTDRIERGELVHVLGPLDFTVSHNDGVAFGLAGGGGILVILLAGFALVALGAFIASAPESNLTDRIRIGHVTDFILLPSWPAFNLADCAITVGVIMLALALITGETEGKARNGAADDA
jgi:signal peptidase II